MSFADLLINIRTQVLMKLIKPYTRIQIPFISKQLNIDKADVESLLVSCILDKYGILFQKAKLMIFFNSTIDGRIDQVNQVLVLNAKSIKKPTRYEAFDKWSKRLSHLQSSIILRI